MRTLVILLLFCLPSWATWSIISTPNHSSCTAGNTNCVVTITSTGSGHALALMIVDAKNVTVTSITDGHSGTYTQATGCTVFASGDGAQCFYNLTAASGITSITVNGNVTWGSFAFVYYAEFSSTIGVAFDTSNNTSTTTSVFTAPALTISGSNDIFFQGVSPTSSCSAINGGYTGQFFSGLAAAYLINQASYTAPTWTCSGASSVFSAIAFKEAVGVPPPKRRLW